MLVILDDFGGYFGHFEHRCILIIFRFKIILDILEVLVLPPSHFICPLFHFGMSQNIVLFLKIKIKNASLQPEINGMLSCSL